jgi:Na+/H+-dicarboxylate symporter
MWRRGSHSKRMSEKRINYLSAAWRIINAALAVVFAGLIIDAWIQIFYFKNAEKYYYYIATLFIIPLITCLIVVFGWDLDNRKG